MNFRRYGRKIDRFLNIGILVVSVIIIVTGSYIGFKLIDRNKQQNAAVLEAAALEEKQKKLEEEQLAQLKKEAERIKAEKEKEKAQKEAQEELEQKEEEMPNDGFKHSYEIIYDDLANWNQAKEVCETLGGHLVTINSKAEEEKIINMLNETDLAAIWIGGTDVDLHGTYQWLTGEPMDYTNWPNGEPNMNSDLNHYMVLYKIAGEWLWKSSRIDTNTYYNDKMGYIIEWETPLEEVQE